MPLGELRRLRCLWCRHKDFDRYEFVTALGGYLDERRHRSGPLVYDRRSGCDLDQVIMSYAPTNGYIVFTNDLDFGTLLAIAKSQLPSVVQVRNQDLLPAAIGDVVILALRQVEQQLESGALVTIDRSRLRIRILPIG